MKNRFLSFKIGPNSCTCMVRAPEKLPVYSNAVNEWDFKELRIVLNFDEGTIWHFFENSLLYWISFPFRYLPEFRRYGDIKIRDSLKRVLSIFWPFLCIALKQQNNSNKQERWWWACNEKLSYKRNAIQFPGSYLKSIQQVLHSAMHVHISPELHSNVAFRVLKKWPWLWGSASFGRETLHLVHLQPNTPFVVNFTFGNRAIFISRRQKPFNVCWRKAEFSIRKVCY